MRRMFLILLATILAGSVLGGPYARAEEAPVVVPEVLITEVGVGHADTKKEFVELHNLGSTEVDLSGWQIKKITAGSPNGLEYAKLADGVKITAGGWLVITTPDTGLSGPQVVSVSVSGSKVLSASGGHLRLVAPQSSMPVDEMMWGSAVPVADERDMPCLVEAAATNYHASEKSYKRMQDPAEGLYIDSNLINNDFCLGGYPTPGAADGVHVSNVALPVVPDEPADPGDTENPDTETPDEGENPEQTDGENPTTPDDQTGNPTDPTSETGQNNTENESNNQPPTPEGTPENTAEVQNLHPSITELLPDPVAPQTDSADEFIELYNPHAQTLTLKDYKLQTGSSWQYSYILEDITLLPGAYLTFTAAQTPLSLTNSGGQVRLLTPAGEVVDEVLYPDTEAGQAWSKQADGTWAWTTKPTPAAVNELVLPPLEQKSTTTKTTTAKAKKTTTAAIKATKKATTPKEAKPKAEKTKDVDPADALSVPASTTRDPNYWLIGAVGAFVVGYGIYEYRHDLQNLWRRLRERALAFKNRSTTPGID